MQYLMQRNSIFFMIFGDNIAHQFQQWLISAIAKSRYNELAIVGEETSSLLTIDQIKPAAFAAKAATARQDRLIANPTTSWKMRSIYPGSIFQNHAARAILITERRSRIAQATPSLPKLTVYVLENA